MEINGKFRIELAWNDESADKNIPLHEAQVMWLVAPRYMLKIYEGETLRAEFKIDSYKLMGDEREGMAWWKRLERVLDRFYAYETALKAFAACEVSEGEYGPVFSSEVLRTALEKAREALA